MPRSHVSLGYQTPSNGSLQNNTKDLYKREREGRKRKLNKT
jgi:hypothetical protein